MFEITDKKIVPPEPDEPNAGGFVTFEGRVRNTNEGRPVSTLEYEALPAVAINEGTALIEEASRKFGLIWAHAIHRVGKLELGEVAVWIGCGAPHRKEAFQACEYIIDELKHRLPIWKKEHYVDGPAEWVNLHQNPPGAQIFPSDVFDRQLLMPEVGPQGQAALQKAKVLVVGAGGLASSALPYLAAAGVGKIGIVEPDLLDLSNLHRQVLFGHGEVGRSKAQLAAAAIRKIHPFAQVEAFEERLSDKNVDRITSEFDIVVDGTDRFDAKFLMNDACQRLGLPLVQASIYRMEGLVQTILPGGPCLRCLWEEEPADGCVKTCSEAGVLGVVPGFFGIIQATEVIKLITGFELPLANHQLIADLRDYSIRKIARTHREGCLCQSSPSWEPNVVCLPWEVSSDEVKGWSEPFACFDLREETESRNELQLGQQMWKYTPLSTFQPETVASHAQKILLVCASGARSGRLAFRLREQGFSHVYSLKCGASKT